MHQEAHHRTVYQTILALAIPTLLLAWWMEQGTNAYIRYAYPTLAVGLAWVLWELRKRQRPLPTLERITFWLVTLLWLGLTSYQLFGHPEVTNPWLQHMTIPYLGLILLNITAFLVYPTRQALLIVITIITLSTLLGTLRVLTGHTAVSSVTPGAMDIIRPGFFLAASSLLVYLLSSSKDSAAAAALEAEKLRSLALEDALTGLPNRRQLDHVLVRQSSIAARHQRPLSLISFDLDHFKQINDTYGHGVGDEVLKGIATCITPALRQGDVFGRWGGEEFLIIAPETDEQAAWVLAERLRQTIEGHAYPFNISVTASFGVMTTCSETNIQKLLANVDEQLYRAKLSGRNRTAQIRNDQPFPLETASYTVTNKPLRSIQRHKTTYDPTR
jgi:diguanylate cyclase (GGDEF)-like protein